MKYVISIFLLSSLVLAQEKNSQMNFENEFELRFNGGKKERGMGDSHLKDSFLNPVKASPKPILKASRNLTPPMPPLPPLPIPDNIPAKKDEVPSKKDVAPSKPEERDNKLSDYAGKYTLKNEYEGSKSVTVKEPIAIRRGGLILRPYADAKTEAYLSFNKDEFLSANYSRLTETIKTKIGGNDLEISGWVSFGEKGNITFLCPAGNNLNFKIGENTVNYQSSAKSGYLQKIFFYEDGSVQSIHIREPQTMKVGNQSYLFDHHEGCGGDLDFHQSGKLKGGYIGKDTSINGVNFPVKSYVEFDENANLIRAGFPGTLTINKYLVKSKNKYWPMVEFYPSGKLKKIDALGKDETIKGKVYKQGTTLSLKEDGTPEY